MSQQTIVREHHWFSEPTKRVGGRFTATYVITQFIFFVALLGPATVGIGVKIQQIVPDDQKTSAVGIVAGFGALAAAVGNVLFGRFSDRTTSRWGRRRPWIVGGTVAMTLAFVIVALGPSVAVVATGWGLAQLGANAAYGPFKAILADQVPKVQRATVAALLGIAQNVGILGGTFVAQTFATQPILLFVGPAVLAIGAMLAFSIILPDQQLPEKPPRMNLAEWATTFWVSPRRHPDFALAWWSRFMIILAMFMFTTFRLFYLQDRLGVPRAEAPAAVTMGVLVYTIALVASGWVAGKISDRTGKRKIMVGGSAALFAIGTAGLAHASTLTGFYVCEVILGLAFGIYVGVDLALVVDVLPNPDDSAKDLGVFNIASALPQTLAPTVGAVLLAIGSATSKNYDLLLYVAGAAGLLGALVIAPIKGVK
jgi:MFS family permease